MKNFIEKISINSDNKLMYNQTVIDYIHNNEFTIINTPMKKERKKIIKYNFYDWEKKKRNMNKYDDKEFLKNKIEKFNNIKKLFFKGLIFYSEMKKIIDITDKVIYSNRFCVLTENELRMYKCVEEFIGLQNPYFIIKIENIDSVSTINVSNVKQYKNGKNIKKFNFFGINYKTKIVENNNNNNNNKIDDDNNVKYKNEVLFLAHENKNIVKQWVNSINNC